MDYFTVGLILTHQSGPDREHGIPFEQNDVLLDGMRRLDFAEACIIFGDYFCSVISKKCESLLPDEQLL